MTAYHNSTNCVDASTIINSTSILVSLLEFNVPFQHKYGYIRDKEGQRYNNLKPGRLFVQQTPKTDRNREAHLNYYATAYNMGRQLSHLKTKYD